MPDVLNDKPLKSFYHASSTKPIGRIQHYLTPLERKAIRDIRKIELENRILEEIPIKHDKENGSNSKSKHINRKSKNRRLHLKSAKQVRTETKQSTSTPIKSTAKKYSWAPKSLTKGYFKDHWAAQAKTFPPSPQLKSIINLSYDSLNKSLPSIPSDFSRQNDDDLKSSSFNIGSDSQEDEPPSKIRKVDVCDRNSNVKQASAPSHVTKKDEELQPRDANIQNQNSSKFFPIFNKIKDKGSQNENRNEQPTETVSPMTPENLTLTIAGNPKTKMSSAKKNTPPKKQMIIDAGQKRFGATQCSMCGMIYSANHPDDEQDHINYHKRFLNFVKFLGWKNERIVSSFMDGRIIKVTPNDPKYAVKKVSDILSIVDIDLGFKTVKTGLTSSKTAYFFISDTEKISGCLIAEKISGAHRLIPGRTNDESSGSVLCFTDATVIPAVCGVSRIWTYGPMRRKKIATRLLDAVRSSFVLGSCLDKNQVAFSDPTPDGRLFATRYFSTPNILVYNFLR